MKNENLQTSDFRHGIHSEDDGVSGVNNIVDTINECSGQDKDALPDDKKPKKINYTEDDCFLHPIELTGKARKTFCNRFKKAGAQVEECNVYLWNKLSDPNVHPNDYLTFEAPSTFSITHVITTCKGIFALGELLKAPVDDQEAFALASQEMLEQSAEFRTEEMDEDFSLTEKELHFNAELPEELLPVDEVLQIEQGQETFENMKIKEVFEFFQSACCKKINDGVCHKRHYLIGTGKVVVENREYDGIHIYLYPDIHYDQATDPEKEIQDSLYRQFQKDKEIRGIQFDSMKYIVGYMNEFREILKQC